MKSLAVLVAAVLVLVAAVVGFVLGRQSGGPAKATTSEVAANEPTPGLRAELERIRSELEAMKGLYQTAKAEAKMAADAAEAAPLAANADEPAEGDSRYVPGEPVVVGNKRYYPLMNGAQSVNTDRLTPEALQRFEDNWRTLRSTARTSLPSSYRVRYVDTPANKNRPTPEQMQQVEAITDAIAERFEAEAGDMMNRMEQMQVELAEMRARHKDIQEQLDPHYRDMLRQVLTPEQMEYIERTPSQYGK